MVNRAASSLGVFVACFVLAHNANAAAPSGAHPRIFLTAATKTAMTTKATDSSSQAARVIARCDDVVARPSQYTSAVYQGEAWAYAAASCGLAWQLTGNPLHAAAGLRMMNALLDDYNNVGDGGGGDDVVRHDTGYAMRFFAPYSALAYDWLHDAPGVAAVLPHARARFKAWVDWYTASGYLKGVAGSNYQAGYVFAKTLIAIAEGGEDGATSDAYWADVTGTLFTQVLIGDGLKAGGAMQGGDWAEGWQYAPLSVLEYSLAARAVEEQGFAVPAMHAWASDLTVRFAHGLAPTMKTGYVGGDTESATPNLAASPRTLLATIAGVGSDEAAGWAAHLKKTVATGNDDCPVFDALAEARGVTPVDYTATAPKSYLAKGTRNLYARSGWTGTDTWAVFTSAPRLVPDHQHVDASNFVFTRGADDLIVDPSPYGTRSTLTSNAVTVESQVVGGSYAPSQTPWSTAEMSFARSTESGVIAARSDFSGAFRFDSTPSDVAYARRDWVFLPAGEVVTIDRVRTDDPSRGMLVRFKTLANVTLSSSGLARGTIGGSDVAIHAVQLSAGAPSVKQPAVSDNCSEQGSCDVGRFATTEYSVRVDGPSSLAVHVIDALATGEAAADVAPMSDPSVDTSPAQNTAVVGTAVRRGTDVSYVVASSAKDGACTSLAYGVPGKGASRHVVFDAPADTAGKSSITTKVEAGRCMISITPGGAGAFEGSPLVFTVSSAADGCVTTEEKTPPPGGDGGTGSTGGTGSMPQSASMDGPNAPSAQNATGADAGASSGCACRATNGGRSTPFAGTAFAGLAIVIGLRRRTRRTSGK